MKINAITATEYHIQDTDLVATFKDTTMQDILKMETALLVATTDAGDTADVYGGMVVRSINYDVAHDQYVTTFGRAFDDTEAGKAITALSEELASTKKELEATVNQTASNVQSNNTALQLAIAELAAAAQQSSTENQLAIAELASTVMSAINDLTMAMTPPSVDESEEVVEPDVSESEETITEEGE